jgi:NAD(P)-dependent dehydrogenase (short-subunit alcohol dehydrogenase family)
MAELDGSRVVVVGASSGIGRAVAELAGRSGARVLGLSRTGSGPEGATGISADARDDGQVSAALAKLDRIDHLVFTAAGPQQGSPRLSELGGDALLSSFEVKLFAALRVIRLALPLLAANASITLTSGQLSRKYGVGTLLKGSVNAAVEAAGKHLAKELAPRRVNVVCPGITDTPAWGEPGSARRTETLARAAAQLPVGRAGTAADVAQAYLLAMTNPSITGAVLDVDGGALL